LDITRKDFIKKVSIFTIGITSFARVVGSATNILDNHNYPRLVQDSDGILDLPKGFSYSIISKLNEKMDDGLNVPNAADGMGCFKGNGNNIILVRNHEIGHLPIAQNVFNEDNPYGNSFSKYIKENKNKFYDIKNNQTECFGGTTTLVYNTKSKKIINQHLSLCGTLVNCSGGQTPWNTWISCEETVRKKTGRISKNHGFNFEVTPLDKDLKSPVPLKSMGRFRHEAVAFDSINGYVYQTEDREDGLLYRFIPNEKRNLKKGGKLQGLSLIKFRGPDCTNWIRDTFKIGEIHEVRWIDLDNVESPRDDLRIRGRRKGCAIFARGEGMWFIDDYVYFTSTSGGSKRLGQIWRYKHNQTQFSEGELELFYESKNKNILKNPDNITVSPLGHLIISEDGKGHDRLIGIKPNGKTYLLAENIFNKSEFAGAVFSPDGKILFVNIYDPTMTIAITGPWNSL